MRNRNESSKKSSKAKKVILWIGGSIVSLFILFIAIGVIISVGDSEGGGKQTAQESKTQEVAEEKATKDAIKSNPEQALQGLLKDAVDSPVVTLEYGRLGINYNVADNLTPEFVREGIENDVYEALKIVDESGIKYDLVVFGGQFPVLDQFGNESIGTVATAIFKKEAVDKINWGGLTADRLHEVSINWNYNHGL